MKKFYKLITSCFLVFTCIISCMIFTSCRKIKSEGKDESSQTNPPQLVTVEVSTYHELKNAAKGSADIIKLATDIDIKSETMNPLDFFVFERKVTLDLNGKKIYSTNSVYNESTGNKAMLEISENAEVTIKGNGKIISNENDAYAIQVANGGRLIIENGEFVGNRTCIFVYEGSVEILGGTFSIQETENSQTYDSETGLMGYGFLLDCHDSNIFYCSILVKGGKFINFNPKKNISNGINTNYMITGYFSTLLPESTETRKIYQVT